MFARAFGARIITLKFSLKRRKNRNIFRLRLRRTEKWSNFLGRAEKWSTFLGVGGFAMRLS